MKKEEELYFSIGKKFPEAIHSKLFGKPCFKLNGKAFMCFFEDAAVFKLEGEMHREALSLDGAKLFDPSGKNHPMKAWIQVPFDYSDKWTIFAEAAVEFVTKLKLQS